MNSIVERVLDYLSESPKEINVAFSARDVKGHEAEANGATGSGSVQASMDQEVGPRVPGHLGDTKDLDCSVRLTSGSIVRLAKILAVSPDTVLRVSRISKRTYRRCQAAQQLLTEAESERILRVACLALEAEKAFGSGEKAARWLSANNRILGAVPLDLLVTEVGSREVECELLRIGNGDFV